MLVIALRTAGLGLDLEAWIGREGERVEEGQASKPDVNDEQLGSLNLVEYNLIRGTKIGHAFDGSIPLVQWMSSVRRSIEDPETQPNATFYFPEEQAGPDLMFALHKKSPEDRDDLVLCVLQVS